MTVKLIPTLLFILTMSITTGDASSAQQDTIVSQIEQTIDQSTERQRRVLKETLAEVRQVRTEFDTLKSRLDSALSTSDYKYKIDTADSPYPGKSQLWISRFVWDTLFREWIYDVKFKIRKIYYK